MNNLIDQDSEGWLEFNLAEKEAGLCHQYFKGHVGIFFIKFQV